MYYKKLLPRLKIPPFEYLMAPASPVHFRYDEIWHNRIEEPKRWKGRCPKGRLSFPFTFDPFRDANGQWKDHQTMVDAALSLATEIDYRIQRGSSLMGRVRVYVAKVLRRRVQESWDNGIIVLPWSANQLENGVYVFRLSYTDFRGNPEHVGIAVEYCLDRGSLLLRNALLKAHRMAAQLKLDEVEKEEAELMVRRNQGLVNILESWSITQGHNRSVSKTPRYIIPIEETPLVPHSISDEEGRRELTDRSEAWSPMPGEKDSDLKTPRHVPAKETLPSRD